MFGVLGFFFFFFSHFKMVGEEIKIMFHDMKKLHEVKI